MSKKYRVAGLGGTFDHFHVGHQYFIDEAARLADLLIVGLSTDTFIQHKSHVQALEAYLERKRVLAKNLTEIGVSFEIIPLDTVAGPALTDKRIEAVIVSAETEAGGHEINRLRVSAGLPQLPIEVLPLKTWGNGRVSSGAIRAGHINRGGNEYSRIFTQTITINAQQRLSFGEIQGSLVASPNESDHVRYLVGDSTVRRFQKEHQWYTMAIIDGKEQRTEYHPLVVDPSAIDMVLVNPAGSITPMLAKGLAVAHRQQLKHIFVDGEEDLAAAVLMLTLPLGTCLYYGQPDQGLVRWLTTEQEKERLALLFDPHFQTKPKLVE